MFAEIAAFFFLICTPAKSNEVNQECLRWVSDCWIHEMQQGGRQPWDVAEKCSEELPPELSLFHKVHFL